MNLAPCKGNVNPHINKSDKDNDITNKVEQSVSATGFKASTVRIFRANPMIPNIAEKIPNKTVGKNYKFYIKAQLLKLALQAN